MATQNVRTVVYFLKEERDDLEKLSEKTGAPMGELIRRAVSAYLDKELPSRKHPKKS